MSSESSVAIEERLLALEAASDQRQAELRSVLNDLPQVVSRRSLVTSALHDLRAAPAKVQIAQRGVAKLGRIPASAARRIRSR